MGLLACGSETPSPFGQRAMLRTYSTLGRPLLNLDELAYLRAMKAQIDVFALRWPESQERTKSLRRQTESLPLYRGLLTKMIMPIFERALWTRERTAADLGDARDRARPLHLQVRARCLPRFPRHARSRRLQAPQGPLRRPALQVPPRRRWLHRLQHRLRHERRRRPPARLGHHRETLRRAAHIPQRALRPPLPPAAVVGATPFGSPAAPASVRRGGIPLPPDELWAVSLRILASLSRRCRSSPKAGISVNRRPSADGRALAVPSDSSTLRLLVSSSFQAPSPPRPTSGRIPPPCQRSASI